MRVVLAVLAASSLYAGIAVAGDWKDEASPYDVERIDSNSEALRVALDAAFAAGSEPDIATVKELLGSTQRIEGEALIGDWRCRTIKLGGNFAKLIVYGWFKCRISVEEDGLYFEKLTGSQRTAGYLRPVYPESSGSSPVRYIYLGSSFVQGEPKGRYGGPGNDLRRVAANKDDPAILEALSRDRLRMGFPWPVVESDYDFLELRR